MRPLARLHAVTDASVLSLADLGVRAAALAAAGPAVALHARDRGAPANVLAAVAKRFLALASPPEAAVVVSGRPDLAAGVHAQGVQLSDADLAPDDARRVFGTGWIGRSAHSVADVTRAQDEGADYALLGNVFETPTHPDRPALGLDALHAAVRTGLPIIAVGGITVERAAAVQQAGAWGIAAIRGLWNAEHPYAAARAMLAPWTA